MDEKAYTLTTRGGAVVIVTVAQETEVLRRLAGLAAASVPTVTSEAA